jgi:hypothetical protein
MYNSYTTDPGSCMKMGTFRHHSQTMPVIHAEAAYLKILESSQTLLTVLKREAVNISKKKQASS